MKLIAIVATIMIAAGVLYSTAIKRSDEPVELGKVRWQRDLEAAKAKSAETGKPIFVLFQEVPG